MIQTGLPRHSTTSFSGLNGGDINLDRSASSLGRLEGWKLLTKWDGDEVVPAPPVTAVSDEPGAAAVVDGCFGGDLSTTEGT